MAQRPVTLTDIVSGHVSLEIEGFDRLYFNGWVPGLQTSGQVAGWLHWRGFPIASPAALEQNAQAFRAAVRRYADGNLSRIPLPLTGADREHGCWWQLSMRQVEVSRTLVFDDSRRVRTVFEELLAGNMNLGRPEHAEIIFGQKVTRKTPGVFSTRLLNRGDQVTINLSFKHSRIKIYLKEDRALRVETVINSPGDLGCKRDLEHLDELAAKARACNARLMDAVVVGQGSGILANPVIERIAHPTTNAAGRRVPAMRFADPRVQALAGCLAVWEHAVSGITNKSLRAWMAGLLGVPYAMSQACYDLARLRGNGLIERIGGTNTYRLTTDGLTFALVYSRVRDQVLYPLTAHDQPIAAPAPVRAAWRTITRHIDSTVAATRLGRAA
jgi:hypothetical protein